MRRIFFKGSFRLLHGFPKGRTIRDVIARGFKEAFVTHPIDRGFKEGSLPLNEDGGVKEGLYPYLNF